MSRTEAYVDHSRDNGGSVVKLLLRLFGGLFTGIGVIVTGLALLFAVPAMTSLAQRSATVQGIVVEVIPTTTTSKGRTISGVCLVKYRFDSNGHTYQKTNSVSSNANCGLAVGDSISLTYDPANPNESSLAADAGFATFMSGGFLVLGIVFLVIGIGIIWLASRLKLNLVSQTRTGFGLPMQQTTFESIRQEPAEPDQIEPTAPPGTDDSGWPRLPQ
jgi:hypothetical protein